MKKMKREEIDDFINSHVWATLCTVDADGNPYAIELNYFLLDGYICGLIKPRGRTSENIERCQNVCLKMCKTNKSASEFQAVSCFGKGEFVDDPDGVLKGWDLLEQRMNLPKGTYAQYKEKFLKKKKKYPLFKMKPEKMTGISSR